MQRYAIELTNEDYEVLNDGVLNLINTASVLKLMVDNSMYASRHICELDEEVKARLEKILQRKIFPFCKFAIDNLEEETLLRDIDRFINDNAKEEIYLKGENENDNTHT